MSFLGRILWHGLFLVLFLFAVIQLILGNCGILGFVIGMMIVIPGIVINGLRLYLDIRDYRNWVNYKMNQKPEA